MRRTVWKDLELILCTLKNGIFKLTKCGLSPESFCILRSVTRIMDKSIIATVTGTDVSLVMQQRL